MPKVFIVLLTSTGEFRLVLRGVASCRTEDEELDKFGRFMTKIGKTDLLSNVIGYERPPCRELTQLTHYQKNALTLFLSFSSAAALQEFASDVAPCMNDKHRFGKSMVCPVHNRGGKVEVKLDTKRPRV